MTTRAADRLRVAIVALAWVGFVVGAVGVTFKALVVLVPSAAARLLAPGRPDALLTGALALDLVATAVGVYDHVGWWDDVAHTVLPALLLGVLAARLAPAAAFAAVVAVGASWELVELSVDAVLGTHLSLGAGDTALDLACDVAGAAIGLAVLLWSAPATAVAGARA